MKKQFIAKLLVLVMVLAMVPVAVLAADAGNNNVSVPSTDASTNDPYNNPYGGGDIAIPEVPFTPVEPDDSKTDSNEPETPVETVPEVVETIDNVKTETNADGQTVVTATIEVKDAAAPVEVSEKAVDALVSQAQKGDVVAIVAETSGAVSAPASKLADLIEKTGNPVSLGNSVAAVAVNETLVKLAGGAEVKVEPTVNDDGTINVPVTAGGKEIAPESVPGGIDVEVAVSYTARQVAAVNAIKTDKTEVSLKWSISAGKLQVNLTVTGSIQVVRK